MPVTPAPFSASPNGSSPTESLITLLNHSPTLQVSMLGFRIPVHMSCRPASHHKLHVAWTIFSLARQHGRGALIRVAFDSWLSLCGWSLPPLLSHEDLHELNAPF